MADLAVQHRKNIAVSATTACSGADAQRAVETGLKAAEWYHTDVPRKEMKAFMQRADQPAIRDTIHLARVDGRARRHRDRALGQRPPLAVGAVLARLRRALRLGLGLALA